MIRSRYSSALPLLVCFAFACLTPWNVSAQETNTLGCVDPESVNTDIDLFPHKVEALHSAHWKITYHDTYKVLQNTHVGTSYLLYQCGTTPPPTEPGEYNMILPVPLQDGIALTQTTHIPHVELLGKRTDIQYYIGSQEFISSPCLNELILDDKVELVDPFNAEMLDQWIANHPEVPILSNSWTDPTLPNRFIISESAETESNQAVFEWHKVFAALYNLEHLGNDVFEETANRYDCVAANAATVESDQEAPKVLWASYVDFFSSWDNTTTTGWQIGFCPNYYCNFVEHCAGEFMQPEEGKQGSKDCWGRPCMTDQEFQEFAQDADFWIYSSDNFNTVYENKKDMMDTIPAIQNKVVYDTYASGSNTWFEQRMAEYDVVLQDMCEVVGTLPEGQIHKRKWFRNVLNEPIGELGICTDVEAPLETQATECTLLGSKKGVAVETIEADKDSSSGASWNKSHMMTVLSFIAFMLL